MVNGLSTRQSATFLSELTLRTAVSQATRLLAPMKSLASLAVTGLTTRQNALHKVITVTRFIELLIEVFLLC